jgi:hypothetical protein
MFYKVLNLARMGTCLLVLLILNANTPVAIHNNPDSTTPKNVETPFPTVRNIAIEWYIDGDANQNGRVEVMYRIKGTRSWIDAMPLRRIPQGSNVGYTWKNRHSGSIFDLKPGTDYEINLKLTDPDGGSATRKLSVSTRRYPSIPAKAEIIELTAGTSDTLEVKSGTREKPVVYTCTEGDAVFNHISMKNRSAGGSGR